MLLHSFDIDISIYILLLHTSTMKTPSIVMPVGFSLTTAFVGVSDPCSGDPWRS